ncbi:hypothetical protein OESDEN_01388 [Oesophagostomum dentatum]|uniref:Uncharacterized protein n=1 Tax=Oesophagostomum dentatum TaxID=61180 RepID=A0A0B1TN46_OESDE|nr:hypothetical protein OESDEN_01388 [Oesophagostomum dentatum]
MGRIVRGRDSGFGSFKCRSRQSYSDKRKC